MPYAVELFFDAATESSIRRLREALSPAGESQIGRPHVALGGCRGLRDVADLTRTLESLAGDQAGPLPVSLAHLGVFPGNEGVLFYGVTVTTPLLLLHRRFHAQFTSTAVDWSPFYQPGHWVPHCTLAYGLTREHLSRALAGLQAQVPPILSGLLISIALVEISSGEEQAVFAFEAPSVPE
jgi:2'-5' RNA ligase